MKSFRQEVSSAIFIAFTAFALALIVTLFTKSSIFGYYILSAGAIVLCYNIAVYVFVALLAAIGVRRIRKIRKEYVSEQEKEKAQQEVDDLSAATS